METELQLKGVPTQLKSSIKQEAERHSRTLAQEAIVLLEEAVVARSNADQQTCNAIDQILDRYEKLPTVDAKPKAEIVEYDELGLPN